MYSVLRKISIRKIRNEKGRSICVMLAVFLTAVLFIMIFSGVFFVKDALNELARKSASWTADAAFIVTDEEYEKICRSRFVSDVSLGQHIGEILDSGEAVETELVSYEEKIAYWMKCYPSTGRLPEKGKEIVISEQYLENAAIQYEDHKLIDITYETDGEQYTDTFQLVGTYNLEPQSKNVMLLSADYYDLVRERLEKQGKNSSDILYKTAEVMYHSAADIEESTNRLLAEINFNKEQGYTMNDGFGTIGSLSGGIYAMIMVLILFVILIGYLFISNIFTISQDWDIKYYGKLSAIGITQIEIKKIIMRQYNILYLVSVIPAMIAGYIFTRMTLPGILNSFFTFQVENKANSFIFILASLFTYLTLRISAGKPMKIAQKVSPVNMKRSFMQFKPVRKRNNRNCLNKFIQRKFQNDKKNVLKIYISIAISIFLANLFYTIVLGFDEKEYIGGDFAADYMVADTTFYSQQDNRNRDNISLEELSECNELPGRIEAGGGAVCSANIVLDDAAAQEYKAIAKGENRNNSDGHMLTFVYGLDDIMIRKMTALDGSIDFEAFKTGQYVLIDALDDEGNTCFHVGDSITIPFLNGNTEKYKVMAVADLPYALSYQSKWVASSNLFLPFTEWSRQSASSDYYMYTYDVKLENQEQWDKTLASVTNANQTLQYQSAKTLADDNQKFLNEIKTVGIVLSLMLLCMGVINFINCIATGIYSRRKEFAVMQSMGTKRGEIIKALMLEGFLYIMGGFVIGCIISIPGIFILLEKILMEPYIKYQFHPMLYFAFAGIGLAAAFLVPCISYLHMDKQETFLNRIRSCRE